MSDEMFLNWHAALTRALLRYGLELGAQWPGGINHVCDQYHQEYGSSVYASLLGLWICCKEIKNNTEVLVSKCRHENKFYLRNFVRKVT